MEEWNNPKPKLHVFVCVNDRTTISDNKTPSCGPTIRPEDVKEIKQWIKENNLVKDVYCTKVLCLGGCNKEGGVVCMYPEGKFIKGLKSINDIKQIIREEASKL